MKITNKIFDEERALYGRRNFVVESFFCNFRYPFRHIKGLEISDTEVTKHWRAELWCSDNIKITDSQMHGIKALREYSDDEVPGCSIFSPEFGWSEVQIVE